MTDRIEYDIREMKDKLDSIERKLVNIEDMLETIQRDLRYSKM